MPRLTAEKRAELESFWRSHFEAWRRSDLNQREYCELHGLPLKRFGNWRAKLRDEDDVPREALLWRRGGAGKHMSKHMSKEGPERPSCRVPSARSGRRRSFTEADKRRIVEETCRTGASVSGVARKYGIGTRLLFAWKKELVPDAQPPSPSPIFLPVTLAEGAESVAIPETDPMPVIVERSAPGIEVELVGGRRVRFAADVDPEAVRRMVQLLEGETR